MSRWRRTFTVCGAALGVRAAIAVSAALVLAPTTGRAQRPDSLTGRALAERPCLRFGFGTWTPPLDWQSAGHTGNADETGALSRRIRDSIFVQHGGRGADASRDGMIWDDKSGGRRVYLFPAWWPAGVMVEFDPTTLARDTIEGKATALIADAARRHPVASVRAIRLNCLGRE